MARIRTKICGVTRTEDAIIASDAGADAIGLVFYSKSPRAVSIETACSIVKDLPPFLSKTGLFVNESTEYIRSVINQVKLDVLQFHGNETQDECLQYGLPFIKAIKMQNGVDLSEQITEFDRSSAILVDTFVEGIPGGTGETFDWKLITGDIQKPVILAGGLTPENVFDAVNQVKPYAVDVSSGVESGAGIKDKNKIIKFIKCIQEIRL